MTNQTQPFAVVCVAWLALLGLSGAGPAAPPTSNANLVKAEPLPSRNADSPSTIVRSLTMLQERVARGDVEAFTRQSATTSDIVHRLLRLERAVWKDARNREALLQYVLSGGDPDILAKVQAWKMFPEDERHLATGALAFAQGDWRAAAEAIGMLDARDLAPTLGGIVCLIQAILASESDRIKALHYFSEARLISPGTLVEETALRKTVVLEIAAGDWGRLEQAALRYAYRFPNSLYAKAIDAQLAAALAAQDGASNPEVLRTLARMADQFQADRRVELFTSVARYSLALGKFSTAAAAGHLVATTIGAGPKAVAIGRALEGAGIVSGARRTEGLKLLKESETSDNPHDISDLIHAARAVASMIEAPAQKPQEDPSNGAEPSTNKRTHAHATKFAAVILKGKASLFDVDNILAKVAR